MIAAALPAVVSGAWFGRGIGRLFAGPIDRLARRFAAPAPAADGAPARHPWMVRSLLAVVTVASVVLLVNIVAGGTVLMRGEPRPNVILISIDTVRADRLGCYGNQSDISPSLDKLAAHGVLFEEAMVNSPWTLPSHGAMLTGVQPSALGLFKVTDRLSNRALTLAEVLHEDGYDTGAIVSYILLDRVYGFDQGFDYFDYEDDQRAEKVVDKALKYLEPRTRQKFFLFLHFYDPHWPYEPPADAAKKFWPGLVPTPVRQLIAETDYTRFALQVIRGPELLNQYCLSQYDGEIYEMDRQLGRLFKFLVDKQMIDRTLIVVTSDHGEEFRDHGLIGHGLTLYDEALHVPLIMRLPLMMPEGVRIKGQVESLDLFPTVLTLVGLDPAPFALAGRDLLPVVQAGAAPPTPLLAETAMSGDPRYALRDGRRKLIQPYKLVFSSTLKIDKPEELFDLAADPREQQNLAAAPSPELDALRQELARRIDTVRRALAAGGSRTQSRTLSPEERERLRSLGYVN
jgi:arylsulfatase A-like enzyme